MPIYEYQCQGCAHEFETIQKISEAPLTTCPSCGKDLLKKKISAVAFRLKGGGWYETDFKSGDKRNVIGRDDGESKGVDTPTGSDSKSDSKDVGTSKTSGESTSNAAGNGAATKESKKESTKPKKSEKTDTASTPAKTKPKGSATE